MTSRTAGYTRFSASLAQQYRVERELGQGGMANVYLAHDVKHDRKVAIKVLKPELAAVLGAERFIVEIKTTAALQHPHILPLFDSGEADGQLYYVMPYIEGETIREKLNRETQFGIDEALRIAREVADALDYAHRHGVIHRDIKPENILLHDGRAMVMDFGIALAVSAAAGGRMTETGLSLGTPHYMSPEQATADREITARSDQYSLASVLYEMLAGQPPHIGGAAQQVIMKIITEPSAPVTSLRKSVPPHVSAALGKALEKLPADRFETAKGFADALMNSGFTQARTAGQAGASGRAGVSWPVYAATVAGAALAGAAFFWLLRSPASVAHEHVVRVMVDLPPGERLYGSSVSSIAISPQGDRVVYLSQGNSAGHLMIRSTGELAARELVAAVGTQAAFSPDGRWVVYAEGNVISKVPADGGPSVTLGTPGNAERGVRGLWWVTSDTILVGSNFGLFAISSGDGGFRRVAGVDSTRQTSYPVVLADGETVAYTVGTTLATRQIGVTSLSSHRTTILPTLAASVLGMREGHLLFVTSAGQLTAVPFDVEGQQVTGDPVQLESNVRLAPTGGALAGLSQNGSLWYVSGQATGHLVRVTPGRADVRLLEDARAFRTPRFSRDGRTIAVEVGAPNGSNIWLYDRASSTFSQLTTDDNGNGIPEWSGDGKRVLFRASRDGKQGVWWQPADRSLKAELLYEPDETFNETLMSPDGKWLLYRTTPSVSIRDIFAVPLSGDRKPVLLVGGPAQESHMRISPNGKWLAYQSDESGRFEIYVRPFPVPGPRRPVSNQGGTEPVWSPSGNEIFYRSATGGIEAASVTAGTSFSVGTRRVLAIAGDYMTDISHTSYDIWPDGSGFLMVKPAGADARPILVHNWRRVLHEKLAAGK